MNENVRSMTDKYQIVEAQKLELERQSQDKASSLQVALNAARQTYADKQDECDHLTCVNMQLLHDLDRERVSRQITCMI